MPSPHTIRRAKLGDVPVLAPLFDAYRRFYEEPADLDLATLYLTARLEAHESVIFMAEGATGTALGFTQLYPTFCSVAAAPVFVLYDLFVAPDARRQGVAGALMAAAEAHAKSAGAAWIKLETATTNTPGQALYESRGWVRDNEFLTYPLMYDG